MPTEPSSGLVGTPRSRVCLVACYLGRLPAYLDCVVRSCELNPSIDWLVLTDAARPAFVPPNMRWLPASLPELRDRFCQRLGFAVALPAPYKLCDFRPAYGWLFADLLAGYDFWGHCDLDQIFGDLRQFLPEDQLARYPRFYTRGHLSLYRNSAVVNEYFRLEAPGIPTYREVFADPRHRQFDEWRGIHPILRYHRIAQYHQEVAVDVVKPTRWRYPRLAGYETPNYKHQLFYWHRGKLFQAQLLPELAVLDHEFAYIHLSSRPLPRPNFDPREVNGFLITPEGFRPYNLEPLSLADFQEANRSHWRPLQEIGRKLRCGLERRVGLRGTTA